MALHSVAWGVPIVNPQWQGAVSNSWHTADNWIGGVVPSQAVQVPTIIKSPIPAVQPVITLPGAQAYLMFVGANDGSSLTIQGGGTLQTVSGVIGNSSNSYTQALLLETGTVNVQGSGSSWATQNLTAGYYGAGAVNVSNGGNLTVTSDIMLGSHAHESSHGTLAVSGAGSTLTSRSVIIGSAGKGTFNLADGAVATTYAGALGVNANSSGQADISGANTTWTLTTGALSVGQAGSGTLRVSDGAAITVAQNTLGIATGAGTVSSVEVTGAGSRISGQGAATLMNIGLNGQGTLSVLDGGLVETTGSSIVGYTAAGKGILVLDGAGSRLSVGGYLSLGMLGTATASVSNGATLQVNGATGIQLAVGSASTGTLNIGAAAGQAAKAAGIINAAGGIRFGSGAAKLVLNHTNTDYVLASGLSGVGTVDVLAGTTILTGDSSNFSGALTVDGGKLVLGNTTGAASVAVKTGASLQVGNGGTAGALNSNVANQGTLIFNRSDALTHVRDISGSGNLVVAGGAITLSGMNTFTGTTTIDTGATLALAGQGRINQSSNVMVNGTFDVTGAAAAQVKDLGGSGTVVVGNSGLAIANATQTFSGRMTGTGGVNLAAGTLALTGDNDFATLGISSGATVRVGAGGTTGAIGADVTNYGTLVFDRADNVSYSGQITGQGAVVKTGANTLSLAGAVSGVTLDVQQGTAQLLGTLSSNATVGANGTLIFANPNATTYKGALSGTGAVVKEGAGTTTFSGDSSAFAGTTTLAGGMALLTGKLGGDVLIQSTGALQVGNGLVDGKLLANTVNNGTLVFNQTQDYDYTGALSGNGSLIKKGNNTLLLSGNYHYTGSTIVEAGLVRLSAQLDDKTDLVMGSGTFDLGGKTQQVSGLRGTAGNLLLTGGALTVQQDSDSEYAGSLTGDATSRFTKSGSGALNLTGASNYTGLVDVNGGRLAINGTLPGTVVVNTAGTLGGNGTAGSLIVRQGGTAAPGNSIGTLHLANNVQFDAGSVYAVEVDAAGNGDKILATGAATLNGGTVQVLAEAGSYNPYTSYLILGADGGVTGRFDNATSNFAFLTPSLIYSANAVTLGLTRNNLTFSQLAVTPNQRATATAVDASFAAGSLLYQALVVSTEDGARLAFDALSGEVHASTIGAAAQQSETLRRAILDRLSVDAKGTQLWVQANGELAQLRGNGNAAKVRIRDAGGLSLGVDTDVGAVRLGVAATYASSDASLHARSASAETRAVSASVYAAARLGAVALRAGASYSDLDVKTSRSVAIGTLSDRLKAKYGGRAMGLYGELGYPLQVAGHVIEPFIGVNALRLKNKAFTEDGGSLALRGDAGSRSYAWSTLGIKGSLSLGQEKPVVVSARVGWQHALRKRDVESTLAFAQGGPAYAVQAAPLAKDAALLDLSLDWKLSPSMQLGVGYAGTLANQGSAHTFKAMLRKQF